MGLRISTSARNAMLALIAGLLDVDGPGSIEVRTGPQPDSTDDAATGTLLVTFALGDPAYFPFFGAMSLNGQLEAIADATGEAGWYRMLDSAGTAVIDGTAGTSDTELVLNTSSITSGEPVSITSGSLTMPVGA